MKEGKEGKKGRKKGRKEGRKMLFKQALLYQEFNFLSISPYPNIPIA